MNRICNGLFVVCLALIAYPIIGGLAAKSEVPQFLGRYSTFMLIFEIAGLAVIAAGLMLLMLGKTRGRAWVVVLLIVFSVAAFGSLSISQFPCLAILMWLARLLAGLALVLTAFLAFRTSARYRLPLAIGALVLCLCVSDAAFATVIRSRKAEAGISLNPFRYDYNLAEITTHDFVFLGDSYVWGCGVGQGEEFGALFGHRLGAGSRSWMLGHIGSNLTEYAGHARSIPSGIKAHRLVFCYYHNDIPSPERLVERIQSLAQSLGKAMPSLVFVSDHLAKALTPTAQDYLLTLVANNNPSGLRFAERMAQLRGQMTACFAEARSKSLETPAFVILPVLLPFDGYPLAAAHERIAKIASEIGFQPLDSLGAFQQSGTPADQLWAAPNDPHFNKRANQIMADFLSRNLLNGNDS